jgi:hypothetical protein
MLLLPDDDLAAGWFRTAGGDAIDGQGDTVSGEPATSLIFNSKSDTRCISISICFFNSMFSSLTISMLSALFLAAGPVLGVDEPDGFVEDILCYFSKNKNGTF